MSEPPRQQPLKRQARVRTRRKASSPNVGDPAGRVAVRILPARGRPPAAPPSLFHSPSARDAHVAEARLFQLAPAPSQSVCARSPFPQFHCKNDVTHFSALSFGSTPRGGQTSTSLMSAGGQSTAKQCLPDASVGRQAWPRAALPPPTGSGVGQRGYRWGRRPGTCGAGRGCNGRPSGEAPRPTHQPV